MKWTPLALATIVLAAVLTLLPQSVESKPAPAGKPDVITNSLGMKLMPIAKGEFRMGSPDGDADAEGSEKPQHKVRVQLHTPESVAAALVRMSRSKRREMILSVEGTFMNLASRVSPAFMDWVLYKTLVRKG